MSITRKTNPTTKLITKLLTDAGIYEEADDLTIQLLADTIDTYKNIKKSLASQPVVYESAGDKGQVMYRQHPAGKLLLEYNDRIVKLLTELNLTTKSRKGDDGNKKGDAAKAIREFLDE
ncbi:P27 family phage terminase small subunit [Vibrio mytili]|uniref:P27 family phage terminase small subunit n=1 Tax=Vibrio mytili TaxID=50718 RepID=UPI002F3F259F